MAKQASYVETDCTFTHEGRTVESGGAVVTDEYAIGYLSVGNVDPSSPLTVIGWRITNWHGDVLGTVTKLTSWPIVGSYVSSTMYQVTALVDGKLYTGRSAGENMIWKDKRVKRS